jgi:membrane fusion protein, heavy metal efflux system
VICNNPFVMKYPVHISKRMVFPCVTAAAIIAVATGFLESGCSPGQAANGNTPQESRPKPSAPQPPPAVDLLPSQLSSIKIEEVGSYMFPVEKEAVGSIDFDGDLTVQVFPAYQGTIINMLADLGAEVQKGQALYTITSPDLIQAESNLIGAAATFDLTSKELARVEGLSGISRREIEQATSDQQTAEGALKAARDAVLVFGKTDAEIDQMVAARKIDPALVVRSPIPGRIISKDAQPGFFVQPGNLPAPYSVADVTAKWMLANVSEDEIRFFHLGQPVQVKVTAYPDRQFKGKVSKLYETVDVNTHRETIRSEIADPNDELRAGMLANFVIRVRDAQPALAIAANGVVREGDGTMTAWVTTDRHHFSQRTITIGARRDDRVQVLDGLQRGELVVADGAVFLSAMLDAPPAS